MSVLHRNKDSLMAVLEAFVYDPLLNWRLIEGATHGVGAAVVDRSKSGSIPSVASASASTSVISEGAISESDTLPEAANNSLDINVKKQSSSENGKLKSRTKKDLKSMLKRRSTSPTLNNLDRGIYIEICFI